MPLSPLSFRSLFRLGGATLLAAVCLFPACAHHRRPADHIPGKSEAKPVLEREYQDLLDKRSNLAEQVKNHWTRRAALSSENTFVNYSALCDARVRIAFDKGSLFAEALVPCARQDRKQAAREKIADIFRLTWALEDANFGQSWLTGQILTRSGKPLSGDALEDFISRELLPEVSRDTCLTDAATGEDCVLYAARVPLVPLHFKARLEKYRPVLLAAAQRAGIDPNLLLAITHTATRFNPRACSRDGVPGLTQTRPGAVELAFLRKQTASFESQLLNPGVNARVAAAELARMIQSDFAGIADLKKREYAAICGFFWDPALVRKNIVEVQPVNQMSELEFFNLLKRSVPPDTRDSLERTAKRRLIHNPMFSKP